MAVGLFEEQIVPILLGSLSRRTKPQYVGRIAIQPLLAHDFSQVRGKQVQLKRPNYWSRRGMTKDGYSVTKTQIIGTERSEPLDTTDIFLTLTEFSGPVDPNGNQSSLHITKEDMNFARINLWNSGNLATFHQSIGSENLADNWQAWEENTLLQELMRTTNKYNPGNAADNATYPLDSDATFAVVRDLLEIERLLIENNTTPFEDGLWHGLLSPRIKRDIESDTDYRETYRSVIAGGRVDPQGNTLIGGNAIAVTPSGMVMRSPLAPMYYGNFVMWPCQVLGDNYRETTSQVTSPARTNINAHLGLFFGMGSVGEAIGGAGTQVIAEIGDYGRHFNFKWQRWGDYQFLCTDAGNSGICVEARTYSR